MSRAELYLSPRTPFTGVSAALDQAKFVFFGVPYDKTSTFRSGSRLGPSALRDISANLELYSIRTGVDLEGVPVHDMGDVDIVEKLDDTLDRVRAVVTELRSRSKMSIMAGGEHSITKPAVESISGNVGVVNFDAHLDMRDEFLGEKLSHATFMRRVSEEIGPDHIMEVGVRAFSKPELDFCRESKVEIITPAELRKDGLVKVGKRISTFLSSFSHSYVTIDIDVLDPAYAPGVGNPEPDGISTDELLTLVSSSMVGNLVGFDLVEVSPALDTGQTAAVGAKAIFEAIAAMHSRGELE